MPRNQIKQFQQKQSAAARDIQRSGGYHQRNLRLKDQDPKQDRDDVFANITALKSNSTGIKQKSNTSSRNIAKQARPASFNNITVMSGCQFKKIALRKCQLQQKNSSISQQQQEPYEARPLLALKANVGTIMHPTKPGQTSAAADALQQIQEYARSSRQEPNFQSPLQQYEAKIIAQRIRGGAQAKYEQPASSHRHSLSLSSPRRGSATEPTSLSEDKYPISDTIVGLKKEQSRSQLQDKLCGADRDQLDNSALWSSIAAAAARTADPINEICQPTFCNQNRSYPPREAPQQTPTDKLNGSHLRNRNYWVHQAVSPRIKAMLQGSFKSVRKRNQRFNQEIVQFQSQEEQHISSLDQNSVQNNFKNNIERALIHEQYLGDQAAAKPTSQEEQKLNCSKNSSFAQPVTMQSGSKPERRRSSQCEEKKRSQLYKRSRYDAKTQLSSSQCNQFQTTGRLRQETLQKSASHRSISQLEQRDSEHIQSGRVSGTVERVKKQKTILAFQRIGSPWQFQAQSRALTGGNVDRLRISQATKTKGQTCLNQPLEPFGERLEPQQKNQGARKGVNRSILEASSDQIGAALQARKEGAVDHITSRSCFAPGRPYQAQLNRTRVTNSKPPVKRSLSQSKNVPKGERAPDKRNNKVPCTLQAKSLPQAAVKNTLSEMSQPSSDIISSSIRGRGQSLSNQQNGCILVTKLIGNKADPNKDSIMRHFEQQHSAESSIKPSANHANRSKKTTNTAFTSAQSYLANPKRIQIKSDLILMEGHLS